MSMSNEVKEILVKKIDEFLEEIGIMADGEFMIGSGTSCHMADAVETVWNAMGYSAGLETGTIPVVEIME